MEKFCPIFTNKIFTGNDICIQEEYLVKKLIDQILDINGSQNQCCGGVLGECHPHGCTVIQICDGNVLDHLEFLKENLNTALFDINKEKTLQYVNLKMGDTVKIIQNQLGKPKSEYDTPYFSYAFSGITGKVVEINSKYNSVSVSFEIEELVKAENKERVRRGFDRFMDYEKQKNKSMQEIQNMNWMGFSISGLRSYGCFAFRPEFLTLENGDPILIKLENKIYGSKFEFKSNTGIRNPCLAKNVMHLCDFTCNNINFAEKNTKSE